MSVGNHDYLIIGGSTKCGTTSLFAYLADHPEVCPAAFKESRFFLGVQEPLESRFRLERDGIDAYGELFSDCTGRVRMEATPDYLYSAYSAEQIAAHLPRARMVFILRDPVERLVSWYRFARQRALLDNAVSFEAYVERQMSGEASMEQHMRALEQGRYGGYLETCRSAFGDERILVLHFDDLKRNPEALLRKICLFAGIDPGFYAQYRFEVRNRTQAVRNQAVEGLYIRLRKNLRFLFHGNPAVMKLMRWANKGVKRLLQFNRMKAEDVEIPDALRQRLLDYYADEIQSLEELRLADHGPGVSS